jgi:hypothetical protein
MKKPGKSLSAKAICLLQGVSSWIIPSASGSRRCSPFYSGVRCGCSSVVEHNLAKVGVVGSNPITRSIFQVSRSKDRVPSDCFQTINVREQEFGVLWCG